MVCGKTRKAYTISVGNLLENVHLDENNKMYYSEIGWRDRRRMEQDQDST
jgi:hypothetical protein